MQNAECILHSSFRIVSGCDDRLDAAAHRKVADDGHAPRLAGGNQVVEDLVGHVLVEDAPVAELDEVILQRLELDAARAGRIRDADLAEIGQPRLGAYRGEFGARDRDLVIPLRARVGEGLERRA